MYIRKIVTFVVFVSLCSVLALVTFDRTSDAFARSQRSSTLAAQSASSESTILTGLTAYDSGWNALGVRPDPISVQFTHNLGGDPDSYIVSLECRDDTSLGTYDCTDHGFHVNALWYGLTGTIIKVYVPGSTWPDDIRVRIYKNVPAYDSGWDVIGARPDPISMQFTHSLGGNPDSYLVSLECRDDTSLGTYDCTDHGFHINASWYGLTDTIVKVYVTSGTKPDEIRVRIYKNAPAYDSGWDAIGARPDPISMHFTHNLGGNPDGYLVSLECRDRKILDTYDCIDNGFLVNALWYGLTGTNIKVYVASGTRPDDIRVRIWRANAVYLPLVVRDLGAP